MNGGDGTEDPKLFNPTDLDARQWVRAAKAAGITRMILTAKHHDGFCLWPSKYTEHCVRNSPWRNGHGDVVKEFVDACQAEGMHYGIYISPWDRHESTYGDSPSALSQPNLRIDGFEFVSGVADLHLPIDAALSLVDVRGPG